MPRANRYFLPGHIWHITHRCHERAFLLRFQRDRLTWCRWLYEARRRYGLCVLNYIVTSNHIHLLVRDRGEDEIVAAMRLAAGRTAQAFNRRKRRAGAFWEDRYHATAVEAGSHLARCLIYIDLNMVRTGRIHHPAQWRTAGFHEIQAPRSRYRIIDRAALAAALDLHDVDRLAAFHSGLVDSALCETRQVRDERWTEALAVGSKSFVKSFQAQLGCRAVDRRVETVDGTASIAEDTTPYRAFSPLKLPQ